MEESGRHVFSIVYTASKLDFHINALTFSLHIYAATNSIFFDTGDFAWGFSDMNAIYVACYLFPDIHFYSSFLIPSPSISQTSFPLLYFLCKSSCRWWSSIHFVWYYQFNHSGILFTTLIDRLVCYYFVYCLFRMFWTLILFF